MCPVDLLLVNFVLISFQIMQIHDNLTQSDSLLFVFVFCIYYLFNYMIAHEVLPDVFIFALL